jgi:hypothetical protein
VAKKFLNQHRFPLVIIPAGPLCIQRKLVALFSRYTLFPSLGSVVLVTLLILDRDMPSEIQPEHVRILRREDRRGEISYEDPTMEGGI